MCMAAPAATRASNYLLVVEDLVRLGRLLQRHLVRDDDARVQLLVCVCVGGVWCGLESAAKHSTHQAMWRAPTSP